SLATLPGLPAIGPRPRGPSPRDHLCTQARTGTIEPTARGRCEPRQCHIAVVRTTAVSHRRGSRARAAGATVKGVSPGVFKVSAAEIIRWSSGVWGPLPRLGRVLL